ncbi:MAG TPA: NUDIX hydrolase [Thermomicrobiales bacterium]|nr:NUDIX hydrolase [Thermomicrobiales bacterium]
MPMTTYSLDELAGAPDLPHETTLATRRAFDGHLLHVRVDDVRLPSGRESVREIVEHPGSAVIVPVTVDGHLLMIRQYRYVIDDYLLELPAGVLDPGEDALTAARRELIEETGHEAGTIRELSTVYVSPGYTHERSTLVLAEGCVPVAHEADQDEPIQLVLIPLAEIPALLTAGASPIRNAQAMIGLMWLYRLGMV